MDRSAVTRQLDEAEAGTIVNEQIAYWRLMGIGAGEAWAALDQSQRYAYPYWPEVRAVMMRWLLSAEMRF